MYSAESYSSRQGHARHSTSQAWLCDVPYLPVPPAVPPRPRRGIAATTYGPPESDAPWAQPAEQQGRAKQDVCLSDAMRELKIKKGGDREHTSNSTTRPRPSLAWELVPHARRPAGDRFHALPHSYSAPQVHLSGSVWPPAPPSSESTYNVNVYLPSPSVQAHPTGPSAEGRRVYENAPQRFKAQRHPLLQGRLGVGCPRKSSLRDTSDEFLPPTTTAPHRPAAYAQSEPLRLTALPAVSIASGNKPTPQPTQSTPHRAQSSDLAQASPSAAVRCAGYTRQGAQCKRLVKARAAYIDFAPSARANSEGEDREDRRYCRDHAVKIGEAEGFYWYSASGHRAEKGKWIRFSGSWPLAVRSAIHLADKDWTYVWQTGSRMTSTNRQRHYFA